MSSMSKANQRQSNRHKLYYQRQMDVTPINKVINMARHIFTFSDKKMMDRLKQFPAIDLSRAVTKLKNSGSNCKNLIATLQLAG